MAYADFSLKDETKAIEYIKRKGFNSFYDFVEHLLAEKGSNCNMAFSRGSKCFFAEVKDGIIDDTLRAEFESIGIEATLLKEEELKLVGIK